jgi:hypothetical protein
MAQRLAAVYDPTGAMFNVKPVITLEDGRVVTLESTERKKEREAQKQAGKEAAENGANEAQVNGQHAADKAKAVESIGGSSVADRLNPERMAMLIESKMPQKHPIGMSKTQQKKMEQFAPRPPPPKPTIPEGIDLPSDEEENWLELWDLPDEELERRVMRAKKRAARARKELRIKQKTGKPERRAARDEKRRVYRELKQSWKIIREEERRRRKFLVAMEDEERKRLAIEVTSKNRRDAMNVCKELGFTLENVEGVADIQPRALGMKGMEVDFNKLEFVGDQASGLRIAGQKKEDKPKTKSNRVNLGAIADESRIQSVYGPYNTPGTGTNGVSLDQNFVEFGDEAQGQEHHEANFNHKLRRKLRRAMEAAQAKKEELVREAAIKHCEEKGLPVDPVLRTPRKPENIRGARTMPDGSLETAKQERVRARIELTEFNNNAKILRKQAKDMAIEAGIRIYLELMGRIPKRKDLEENVATRAASKMSHLTGRRGDDGSWARTGMMAGESMADLLAAWPIPKDEAADDEAPIINGYGHMYGVTEESSEDSAARQLQTEATESQMNGVENGMNGVEADSEEERDSDEEDSDVEMADSS